MPGDLDGHHRRPGARARRPERVGPGGPGGGQPTGDAGSPSLSADGRYAAFLSTAGGLAAGDTNGPADVFVTDSATATTLVSRVAGGGTAVGDRWEPDISADGRWIGYASARPTLWNGATTDGSAIPGYPAGPLVTRATRLR